MGQMTVIEEGLKFCPVTSAELEKERKVLDKSALGLQEWFHRSPLQSCWPTLHALKAGE